MKRNYPIILDCDTGEDDALAILVALANTLPMKYIVASYGNTSLENSTANSANVVGLTGNRQVKIIPFSKFPLKHNKVEKHVDASNFIGENGLCNTKIAKVRWSNISHGWPKKKLIHILQEQKQTDYIITGPCTNFAQICRSLGDEVTKYIHAVYIMGGAIHTGGNSGPVNKRGEQMAEFNFYCDPYAVNIVLETGLPIYLVTWDITKQIRIPYKQIQNFQSKTKAGKFVIQMMKNFFTYYGLDQNRDFELNDPVTILARMGWGKYKKKKIKILTAKNNFGKVVLDKNGYVINYFYLHAGEKEKIIEKILKDIKINFKV